MPQLPSPFRARGDSASRMEAFSDAVFAFAVTLLVVSLDVPRTFTELKALTAGFLGFALSFAMIVMLWRTHTRFYQRFALDDTTTLWLNSILLFLVLFFVYPLKFLFTLVSSIFVGREAVFGDVPPLTPGDGPELMLLYGGGFFAMFATFSLMYLHALRKADVIGLSAGERAQTRTEAESLFLIASIGLLSVAVAYGPDPIAPASGLVYFLIGPMVGLHAYLVGRRRLQRVLDAEAEPLAPEAGSPNSSPRGGGREADGGGSGTPAADVPPEASGGGDESASLHPSPSPRAEARAIPPAAPEA
ncbi:MAG: TMEM175 family protein [Bacteroidota bacterium]